MFFEVKCPGTKSINSEKSRITIRTQLYFPARFKIFSENITIFLGQADREINKLTVLAYIYHLEFFAEFPIDHLTIPHRNNPQLINTPYSFQILEEYH